MNKIFAVVLILISLPSLEDTRRLGQRDKTNMEKAIKFMTQVDKELNRLSKASAHASWNWLVNFTELNLKIKENASKIASEYSRKVYSAARQYPWKSYKGKNSTLYRWFELAAMGWGSNEMSGLFEGKEEDSNPYSEMSEIFGKVKICPPGDKENEGGECNEDVLNIFQTSKDPEELKYYWLEVRKQTGEKYKDLFLEAIKLDNEDSRKYGYKNKGAFNIAIYEDKEFVKNMAEEMRKILPLYKQIHAYVRTKLRKHHDNIKRDGPIPAHLLGDMYAQKWTNIFETVKPYPNSDGFPNVTKAMKAKETKVVDMFIMAEKFFTSIGLPAMTPHFWRYSMIRKPVGRDVECHASAHSFSDGKDYRIKMCTKVNTDDLETVHHEMGHIEYYMLYDHIPFLFRDGANPGFHEAIGDVISLSALTPSYLEKVGLLKKNEIRKNKEFLINYLLDMALRYYVTVPYAYIIDYWRNKVYEGTIKDDELNKKYWQYRLQYQGVCPPSKRSEEHFDIGAKFHIASGVEYNRYYVANILMFQIHKILCREAGHKGPLHECNIYKNKKAGKAFAKLLSQGKSKNWKQLLQQFSGGTFRKMDASAILEYFKPLMDWLRKRNSREYIGWHSDDPMSCPGDEESTGSDTTDTSNSGVTGSEAEDSDIKYTAITNQTESSPGDENSTGSDRTDTTNSGVAGSGAEDSDIKTPP